MNKADLIDAISNITGFTKSDAGKSLDALVEVLQKNIKKKVTTPRMAVEAKT